MAHHWHDSSVCNPNGHRELTQRESEVLALVVDGHGDLVIGTMLGISQSTVRTHLKNLLEKSSQQNRVQLAVWAVRYVEVLGKTDWIEQAS